MRSVIPTPCQLLSRSNCFIVIICHGYIMSLFYVSIRLRELETGPEAAPARIHESEFSPRHNSDIVF